MKSNPQPVPPLHVPTLLRKYDLHPRKRLGQNFLIDHTALMKVISAADIKKSDTVLEVGPGLGSLTRLLAIRARRVVCVELDKDLFPPLQEVLTPFENIRIIQGDILSQDIQNLISEPSGQNPSQSYIVVANIPYYITSALIRYLLEAPVKPERIILTVQREVAQRICANPPDLSLMALGVQVYGKPEITAKIPAGAFYPIPKVDSAVIRVSVHPAPLIPEPYTQSFFQLSKAAFGQKRKTLRNSLSGGLGIPKDLVVTLLESANINPSRRAETLSIDDWQSLTTHFHDQFDRLTSI